jgi:hypothetical protein
LLEGSIIIVYSLSKRDEENESFLFEDEEKKPLLAKPKRKCKEKIRKQGVDDVFASNFAFGNSDARSF